MWSSFDRVFKTALGNFFLMMVLQRTIIAKFDRHPFKAFISAYITKGAIH